MKNQRGIQVLFQSVKDETRACVCAQIVNEKKWIETCPTFNQCEIVWETPPRIEIIIDMNVVAVTSYTLLILRSAILVQKFTNNS